MATSKKKTNAQAKSVEPPEPAPKSPPAAAPAPAKSGRALLLSCMDLRVIDETASLMDELGYKNKYDHVAIAGSSLGVLTATYRGPSQFEAKKGVADLRHFGKTFWNHVDLAIALHQVDRVVIIEHGDCGAYKYFVKGGTLEAPIKTKTPPADCRRKAKNVAAEIEQHKWYANELRRVIKAKYPLEVDICLVTPWMPLTGKK